MKQVPGKQITGYAGKILVMDLTDSTTSVIPSSRYLPEYVGGREACNRIYYDLVKERHGAFDPQNTLVFMTGAGGGTGLPISGRAVMTGVAANNLPEQYTHGCIGGFFPTMLKYAGYDGFVLTGKAPKHTCILIEDDKVSFIDAAPYWGKLVQETQTAITDTYGLGYHSLVIGPAGENLCRNATVTTNNDNVLGKSGFGAVFGSKNLKAIIVHGTGSIRPSDVNKVLENRLNPCHQHQHPEPMTVVAEMNAGGAITKTESSIKTGFVTSCMGCNDHCVRVYYDVDDAMNPGRKIAITNKCVDPVATNYTNDCGSPNFAVIHSHRQERPGSYRWFGFTENDPDDPDLDLVSRVYPGDKMDLYGPSIELEQTVTWLCNEYGIDKWDMICWYMSWLGTCRNEGLLEDFDFGFKVDPSDPESMKKFIHMVVYREGKYGPIFAEGMARAVRTLGKAKYGDAPYHGRFNSETGENLEIPLSFESSWGNNSHWQGRGFQNCPKFMWLAYNVSCMLDSRDALGSQHAHCWVEEYKTFGDDLEHSDAYAEFTLRNVRQGDMKDSVITCDWRTPNIMWPTMEAELYSIATGIDVDEDDLMEEAERSRLLYRAILMRDFDRTRDLEVENIFGWLTYPDPWGEVCTWDDFNDFVDTIYTKSGWDIKTGWPTRESWDKAGLSDIGDDMAALGKLPDGSGYTRKANPFDGHILKAGE